MNKIILYSILVLSLINSVSLASVEVDPLITKCHITPRINLKEARPKEFNNNNNLRRYTYSMQTAKGKPIIIAGRVMDKNCIPVTGAILKIWHKNSFGVYQDKNSNKKLNDPNFVGTGTSYTDNFGRFNFITILPGASKNSLPDVNIIINHEKLPSLTTKIFLNNNPNYRYDNILRSMSDINAKKLIAQSKNETLDSEETIYYIDLVIDDILQYKSY